MEIKNIPDRSAPLLDTDWVQVKDSSGNVNWIALPTMKVYNPAGTNGKNPEFSWVDPWLRYRLVGDPTWINLVPKSDIIGPQGIQGEPGNTGAQGDPGPNGRNPQFQSNSTHLQWRLVDDVTWINLVALSAITGPQGIQGNPGNQGDPGIQGDPGADGVDGKNPELGVSVTHIQWRLVGDPTWIDLVALATLKGDQGDPGIQGTPGNDGADGADGKNPEFQFGTTHFQWRLVGDSTWLDLATKASMTGPQGVQGEIGETGADGKSVEMRKDSGQIQWRLIGDASWINIVALTEIKGDQGIQGETGSQGIPGEQGDQGIAGRNIQYHTTDVTLTPANFNVTYFAGDVIKLS